MVATSYISQVDAAAATRKTRTVQRTDGADTVEEWLQSDSEPFLATYTACNTTAIAVTTANSHLFELMAGASLLVGIRRIVVSQIVAATASTQCLFELRRLSTAGTGGTAITPSPHLAADGASGATFMTLASSKGTEGVSLGEYVRLLHQTIATVGINPVLELDFTRSRSKALWIAAGTSNGIALKNVTAVSPATVHISCEFVEASWV